MAEPNVNVVEGTAAKTGTGTAGLETRVAGPTTVSNAAEATGGLGDGNFVKPTVEQELFRFHGDDTPLMQLMLAAKTVNVDSPEVKHYMMDEPRCQFSTAQKLAASSGVTAVLPMDSEDQEIVQDYDTIICKKVDGYDENGKKTPGKDLMLFVVGRDDASGNPIVRAVNGMKTNASDTSCKVPEISADTQCTVLGNAMYETQKVVPPQSIVPQPTILYLQKRGLTHVVSDYFDSQEKNIPFADALIAEQEIMNFKQKGNRTLWISRKSHFKVRTKGMGDQDVYTTEGVRWQFKKEVQHTGRWTYEQFIGLAKMFYTGEDVPSGGICLCGKNFLEGIQSIDFSNHPEIQISVITNSLGWKVTNIHTVFGDLEFKREPTLEKIGYSNSCAIFGKDRIVHYVRKAETTYKEQVEKEEATRTSVLIWDALGLKGTCHIFVDGEGTTNGSADQYVFWSSTEAPETESLGEDTYFYLTEDCPGISKNACVGQLWHYKGGAWKEVVTVALAS